MCCLWLAYLVGLFVPCCVWTIWPIDLKLCMTVSFWSASVFLLIPGLVRTLNQNITTTLGRFLDLKHCQWWQWMLLTQLTWIYIHCRHEDSLFDHNSGLLLIGKGGGGRGEAVSRLICDINENIKKCQHNYLKTLWHITMSCLFRKLFGKPQGSREPRMSA
jgi:hypothetical protein